jgi:hypothetical protein
MGDGCCYTCLLLQNCFLPGWIIRGADFQGLPLELPCFTSLNFGLDFYSASNYSCAELRRLYYFSTTLSTALTKQLLSGCLASRASDKRVPNNPFL